MTGSTSKNIPQAPSRSPRLRFAAAVAVAGSLVIPSTAPALLEGASEGATAIFNNVDRGLDFHGALLLGGSYPPTDAFAAADAASFSPAEAYPGAGSEICDQLSDIDATALPALPNRGSLCFGAHDVIEYIAPDANADRRSVDLAYDKVPSAVRSTIADSRLIQVPPVGVDRDDDDKNEAGKSAAHASRRSHLSAPTKWSRRKAATLHPTGCARCSAQVAQTSLRPAKFIALAFASDLFRAARSVRKERLPTGVARQREAPRMTAWIFHPGG